MTLQTNIKRLNDGSIDYAHYIARSQEIRRIDAGQALVTIRRTLRAAWKATTLDMMFRRGPCQSGAARHPFVHETERSSISGIGHL